MIIDKLPFASPDDPVVQARTERMKARGEDWFNDYMLPKAVLALKQGFGRLIRTRDRHRASSPSWTARLVTMRYGEVDAALAAARPPRRRRCRPAAWAQQPVAQNRR